MIARTLLAAGLATAVVAAGATASAPPPAPTVLTQADTGKTYRVARGRELTLRLSGRWTWSQPQPSGARVVLTPVAYLVDPGFSEWRIRTPARGVVTLRSSGVRRTVEGTKSRTFVLTLRIA